MTDRFGNESSQYVKLTDEDEVRDLGWRTNSDGSDAIAIYGEVDTTQVNREFTYLSKKLLNGANENMAVNGSVTPVTFTYAPGAGETFIVDELRILVKKGGDWEFDEFINKGPLTNGLRIVHRRNSIDREMLNAKNNFDLKTAFKVDTQAERFRKNNAYLIWKFIEPIILRNSTSDSIFITVRDNVANTADYMIAAVNGRLRL